MEKSKSPNKFEDQIGSEYNDIDHSPFIHHVKQSGMQCWSRSSQMILSYILRKLGLSKNEITTVFYSDLFLGPDENRDVNENEYLNLNQRILGRRLRSKEVISKNLDELVIKIYDEFGSTSFLVEVFPSFIKQYLQAFSRVTKRFQNSTVTLIIDNDNEEEIYQIENSCKIIYKTFATMFSNGLKTGLLKGVDKEFWQSLDNSSKIKKLIELLNISPILVESPGHAFVLSGYLSSEKKFIVNDSLASESRVINEKNLLKSLSSLVLLVNIKKS